MGSEIASTRQLSPEKASAILNGAMQEFLARGYAATSMDRVAAAAGVSKATVYSHFKDKQGLFNGLIRYMKDEKFKTVFGPLESHSLTGEPETVLRQLATGMLNSILDDPQALSFVRLIIAESERFPELAKAFVSSAPSASLKAISRYFERTPTLNLPDPEVAARLFIGTLIHYVLFQEVLSGKEFLPMERDRLVSGVVHLLTHQEAK
ncbi:MAG: TetR/AcrR family transcriptional regulator [Synechococcus sp.]